MESSLIRHQPRRFSYTQIRRLEIEPECVDCPDGQPHIAARCPDCDSVMAYRGHGHLHNGTPVHYFECVHSHREVHSVSIVISE
jgi:hypothetical protein